MYYSNHPSELESRYLDLKICELQESKSRLEFLRFVEADESKPNIEMCVFHQEKSEEAGNSAEEKSVLKADEEKEKAYFPSVISSFCLSSPISTVSIPLIALYKIPLTDPSYSFKSVKIFRICTKYEGFTALTDI